MMFRFIDDHRHEFRIVKMAEVLGVSESGYFAWKKRQTQPKTDRQKKKDCIRKEVMRVFLESQCVYGARKIARILQKEQHIEIGRSQVSLIMRKAGIRSKVCRKYKATTNSKHKLPVADNILARDFESAYPGRKMVSDITYIPTAEGWLYLAAVMDLCGRRIVGIAMDKQMKKDLVISALKDALARSGNVEGCILHSDRGSQYCSTEYQNYMRAHGFIPSMSRKGNCWDNAPMESFWGKLKQEWLNGRNFKTRDEAKQAIFEYIWVFYNRKRVNAANAYQTPDMYYYQALNKIA